MPAALTRLAPRRGIGYDGAVRRGDLNLASALLVGLLMAASGGAIAAHLLF